MMRFFRSILLFKKITCSHERKADFRKCLDGTKRRNQLKRIRKFNISKNLLCKTTNDFFSIESK